MIIFANILTGIATVLDMLLSMVIFLVIARAVISWVNPDPYNPLVRFLNSSTEPLLRPLRRYIPLIGGAVDITPIVLLLGLYFLKAALVTTLVDYAFKMKREALGMVTSFLF
ncbi:MAG: YggT family protein [Deltaproteobacteria bacterium]|nr:YggT family protein [Deltaproteobacteria bacterium]